MMIKKRFTIEQTMMRECIVDNTTGEQLDTFDYTVRLCEVLNQLNDENDELKQTITRLQNNINELTSEELQTNLEKENEQLKHQLSNYSDLTAFSVQILNEEEDVADDYATILANEFNTLMNENEQLKKENEKLNYEITELKQSKEDNYNITDGLW